MSSAKCNIHTATTTKLCLFGTSFFFVSPKAIVTLSIRSEYSVSVLRRRIYSSHGFQFGFFSSLVVDVIHVQFVCRKKILFERTFTLTSQNGFGAWKLFLESISIACIMKTSQHEIVIVSQLHIYYNEMNTNIYLSITLLFSAQHWYTRQNILLFNRITPECRITNVFILKYIWFDILEKIWCKKCVAIHITFLLHLMEGYLFITAKCK